eukprot:c7797_g1_i2.p1 GENE.c7797_g1_i2~~c7797_g1_i2.p1  ORF type:complete len:108 (+),score=22.01 c7797_g1_i2:66-389(+)
MEDSDGDSSVTERVQTALEVAIERGDESSICSILSETPALANQDLGMPRGDWTAMQLAAWFGQPQAVVALSNHGADLNQPNQFDVQGVCVFGQIQIYDFPPYITAHL